MEKLINDVMIKLHGKISNADIKLVENTLRSCLADYNLEKKCTELIVYEGLPEEYKYYMVSKSIEGRSQGTLDLYKLRLEDMLTTIQKPLRDITTNDLMVYLYKMQEQRKVSDRTLDSCRLIFHAFFAYCFDCGYIPKNPCASISPIHYESKPREPLNDIEMEKLRKACKTSRETAIVETLYSTGCRCSELANLKIEDVNLESRAVKLFGKGKKHRTSYLNARAVIAIQNYLESRNDDCPFLLCSMRRPYKKLDNGGIENIVKNLGARAGIKDVYPHRIRHTFATDALGHGMNIQELQQLMGHSNTDTTLIYAKVNTNQQNHNKYII